MKDSRIFGVNQRGDGKWVAWTCLADDRGCVVPGSFKELSVHEGAVAANEAANNAREKHDTGLEQEHESSPNSSPGGQLETVHTPLPCPFCGVSLTPNTNQADMYVHRYGTYYDHPESDCFVGGHEVSPSLIAAWNRRAQGQTS